MGLLTHLISIDDLSRKQIESIMQLALQLKSSPEPNLLKGKVIASLFFEASTRTRLSFESAIYRLGGQVIGFSDAQNTSFTKKGESLEDTIRMVEGYADAIIIRHPEINSAKRASEVSTIPVINAGDGANEHPTQTLLDLMTIKEYFGSIDSLHIGLVGDLKYGRTIHSLIKALALFNDVKLTLLNEKTLELPETLSNFAKNNALTINKGDSIESVLPQLDVVYMTRVQKERLNNNDKVTDQLDHQLTADIVSNYAKDCLAIMHPLPRLDEIDTSVDQLKQALYFKQAHNGLYVREALLKYLLIDQI